MATAPVLEFLGENLDLAVMRGVTVQFTHMLVLDDESENPYNLTGHIVRATVRKDETSPVFAAFEVDDSRFDEGIYTIVLPASITATFTVGRSLSSLASRYRWDSEMETPAGIVVPLHYGYLRVSPEVTSGAA